MAQPLGSSAQLEYRPVWPFIATAIALLVAILPMPYVYYMVMRLGVVATCWYALASGPQKDRNYARFAVFIPIMLVFGVGTMSRDQWAPVDVAFSAFFLVLAAGYRIKDWHRARSVERKQQAIEANRAAIERVSRGRNTFPEDKLPF